MNEQEAYEALQEIKDAMGTRKFSVLDLWIGEPMTTDEARALLEGLVAFGPAGGLRMVKTGERNLFRVVPQ